MNQDTSAAPPQFNGSPVRSTPPTLILLACVAVPPADARRALPLAGRSSMSRTGLSSSPSSSPSSPVSAPLPAEELDLAGWQEGQRRIERWFTRRGLPHFIDGHSAWRLVWTRALPALLILVPLHLLGGVLPRSPGDVVVPLAGDILLAGIVYLVASYGVVPLARRVAGRLPGQAAMIVGLVARRLPLLLLIVGLLFFTTEVWQAVGSRQGPGYVIVLLLLLGLALAFLATPLTTELSAPLKLKSWEQVRDLVAGTPAEHLLTTVPAPLGSLEPPSRQERVNAAAVLLVTRAVQVAVVSALFGVVLLVFGLCAVPPSTVRTWTGSAPHVLGYVHLGSTALPLTEPTLRVVGFLTALGTMYFSVASLADPTFRRQLREHGASQLRQAFAVRAVYVACVVPAALGHAGAGGAAAREPALVEPALVEPAGAEPVAPDAASAPPGVVRDCSA